MVRQILCTLLVVTLVLCASIASAELAVSLSLGMKDGSESSDGVTVSVAVEKDGNSTVVLEEHWAEQAWSDPIIGDLISWSGQSVTLKLTTDPGPDRNTGWDWILIGDAKVMADGDLIFDIGQAVADGAIETSVLFDGDADETAGLLNGANCAPEVDSTAGGETNSKSFMQHPPWDGKVGNTISRYAVTLPAVDTASVELSGKLTTTWGKLKK